MCDTIVNQKPVPTCPNGFVQRRKTLLSNPPTEIKINTYALDFGQHIDTSKKLVPIFAAYYQKIAREKQRQALLYHLAKTWRG